MAKSNYKPTTNNREAPLQILNNSTKTGYYTTLPKKSADKSQTWNAVLITTDNQELKLWIEDMVLNFSMSGTSGQSRYRRQFYPKAFNQPTMVVKGKMPNQYEYNRLAGFVRESHFDALNQTNRKTFADGTQAQFDKKTLTLYIKNAGDNTPPKRNLKGGHLVMAFEGYIKNIQAGAKKFQFAPDFQFEFVIAGSKDTGAIGIYKDDIVQGSKIMSWMDVFKQNHFSGSATQPEDPNKPKPASGATPKAATPNTITDPFSDPLGSLNKSPLGPVQ